MPALTSIALGGMAAAGAVGGVANALGQDTSTDIVKTPFERRFDLAPAGAAEQQGFGAMTSGLSGFEQMVGAGPGLSDVRAGVGASRDYASQLQQLSQDGLLPTETDISRTSGLAGQLMAPEQVAMKQAFGRQSVQAGRQAAQLGRSVGDPILQAKMRQAQMEQQERLGARQTSLGTQLAMMQPEQRLALSRERTNVLSGLGGQALKNRAFLTQLGQGIGEAERMHRERTATQTGFNSQAIQTTSTNALGAIGAGLSGALGGLGAGASVAGAFGGFGGGTASPPVPSTRSLVGTTTGVNTQTAAPFAGGQIYGGDSRSQSGIGYTTSGNVFTLA